MYNSYADVLESYMIAEEGIFSKIWKNQHFNNKNTSINKKDISSKMPNVTNDWKKNIKQCIDVMMIESPDIINNEFNLRKNELTKIVNIIDQISKKYAINGIKFNQSQILNYIKNPKNIGDDLFCYILLDPLPDKSWNNYKDNYTWAYESGFNIEIFDYDLYEWADYEYKTKYHDGTVNIRDSKINNKFYKIIDNITKDISNKLTGFKCVSDISCGGDWDGGTYDIIFKPSEEFIKNAQKYGFNPSL